MEKREIKIISSYDMKQHIEAQGQSHLFVDVKSKIPSLDDAVEGFQDGELIVISGPTKNGKTLLAQTLTNNFVEQQHFPLWFTYEVPARQFLRCFGDNLPLFYMPVELESGRDAMQWVERAILCSLEENGTRIVFIDHLHYLFDMAQSRNPSIHIGTVIRRLKTLSVKHNLVIFLLCHTSKGASEGDNLSYESIRDSSFVSQESDTVFMIKRGDDNQAKLRVEFHRRTGVFQKIIRLIKIDNLFQEMESTD